jgi:phage shock protein PspC (stress-responsive transcriptional regulator)
MPDRFYRDRVRGVVGGVCAGLAEYFGVRPLWLRSVFVLLTLARARAAFGYVLLWILLPERSEATRPQPVSLRRNLDLVRSEAVQLARELEGTVAGTPPTTREGAHRIASFGGLMAGMGLLYLADRLLPLGAFRLRHLEAIALVLIGAIALNRARQVS